jgi:hypothetical protein
MVAHGARSRGFRQACTMERLAAGIERTAMSSEAKAELRRKLRLE